MDISDETDAETFTGVEVVDDAGAPSPEADPADGLAGGVADAVVTAEGDADGDEAMGDDGNGEGDGEGDDDDEPELDLENLGVDDSPPVRDDAIHICTAHTGAVYAVASVGPIIATGSGDDTGALLTADPAVAGVSAAGAVGDAPPAGVLYSLTRTAGLGESVSCVGLSADGAYAAYGVENGVVAVRGVGGSDGQGVTLFEESTAAINFVAFHPRGPVLLAGDADGTGWLINAATASFMAVFAGHAGAVTCGRWAPHGRTAVTGCADGAVRVWNPKAATVAVTVSNELGNYHPDGVGIVGIDVHPGGDATPVGASGGDDGSVFLWSVATGKVLTRVPPHGDSAEAVTFAPGSGEHLVSGALDGTLRVWDVGVSAERGAMAHDAGVTCAVWHPTDVGLLLSGSLDRTLRLWDARAGGRAVGVWRGHTKAVLDAAWGGGGVTAYSASDDGTVRVWDMRRTGGD